MKNPPRAVKLIVTKRKRDCYAFSDKLKINMSQETYPVGDEDEVISMFLSSCNSDRINLCVHPMDSVLQLMKDFKLMKNTHSTFQKKKIVYSLLKERAQRSKFLNTRRYFQNYTN